MTDKKNILNYTSIFFKNDFLLPVEFRINVMLGLKKRLIKEC